MGWLARFFNSPLRAVLMRDRRTCPSCAVALLLLLAAAGARAERIKDMAQVQGVRTNQLVGYGLVVGLTAPATRPARRRSRFSR